jgi:flagellar hook-associated protein 1 FlgK
MESTFAGIELGKRGLIAHQTALHVTGHNVTNAETEGYSRQQVTLEVFDPLYIPGLTRELTPGQIGQGVQIEKILRARDMLLEDRILSESNGLAYWKGMSDWILQVEHVHNEPTDKSIMHILDKFWASWQELANHPEEIGARQVVKEYGAALSKHITHNYQALRTIRDNIERAIQIKVEEINSYAEQIALLNREILRSEASGDNPNDLWDKRDMQVEKLSSLVNIQVGRTDRDEFIVYVGGNHLIQGKHFEKLTLLKNPDNEGYSDIRWVSDGSLLKINSGEVKSLLDARDIELKHQIDALDTFALNLMDLVNSIHRVGFGLNLRTGLNFFTETPLSLNPMGDHDFSRDGQIDGTAVFRVTGVNTVRGDGVVGLNGTITLNNGITVGYRDTDTVAEVMTRVNNSGSDIKMFINGDNRLVVRSDTPNFYISHLEDSGDFLVQYSGLLSGSGADGAFDYGTPGMSANLSGEFMVTQRLHPSSWIGLEGSIEREVESIAASTGTDTDGDGIPDIARGAGNGDNALAIAGIRFARVMVGGSQTINEYYQALITETGLKGEVAENENINRGLIVENLMNLRTSISGVNIDEELVNLVKFQHGYAAAARFVTEVNKMLEVLINRML